MPLNLRIILMIGSFLTLLFCVSRIRKDRLKISHSIFWVLFGAVLLALACIPKALFWLAELLGFQSPSNLVYLIVIFLLVLKLFTTTLRISKLSEQVTALTQALALYQLDVKESEKDEKTETTAAV